jgi:hypothetical protein
MKALVYRTLSLFFYHLGDIICHIPFLYFAYQWCMRLSLKYDEKIGFKLWIEPDI